MYGIHVWVRNFSNQIFCLYVGHVGVLNGGKICIEKMFGFRGDDVRFFFLS